MAALVPSGRWLLLPLLLVILGSSTVRIARAAQAALVVTYLIAGTWVVLLTRRHTSRVSRLAEA